YAPWCPACQQLQPEWNDFAEWGDDIGVSIAKVDVTEEPGLSGRFIITALPTIYHCKDGVFRKYEGGRTKNDFLSFIEEKKWREIEPVSSWFGPSSFLMNTMSGLFKLSMFIRILVFVADCVFPFRRFTPQNYYQSKSPFLFCNWICSCACIPAVCCGPGLSAVCTVPAQYICMELICVCVVRCLLSALTLCLFPLLVPGKQAVDQARIMKRLEAEQEADGEADEEDEYDYEEEGEGEEVWRKRGGSEPEERHSRARERLHAQEEEEGSPDTLRKRNPATADQSDP
ncbi:Thioredoxin-related transmembrane protein 1, partial [Acipenser ruthenus]